MIAAAVEGLSAWLVSVIPIFKAIHISMLAIWCAGLAALPLMLSRHDPAATIEDYRRIRRYTHLTYTVCVTPAAVIAVVSGTWLIFMREVYVPWMFAKLAFVGLLIGFHAWTGYVLVTVAETAGSHRPPRPGLPLALLSVPILAILVLVLTKPDLGTIAFPEWLTTPRGGEFPFEVPRR